VREREREIGRRGKREIKTLRAFPEESTPYV
jgi:hypothetical protein